MRTWYIRFAGKFALTMRLREVRVGGVRVLKVQMLLLVLLLSACETVRTVYDDNGNVVDADAEPKGERDISDLMEKEFNSSFSVQKTKDGVPLTVSNKVSRYQSDLDAARQTDKEYAAGSYSGRSEFSTMSFAGAGKVFSAQDAYSGGVGKQIEKDLHPDFAKPSRGIYGTDDAFAQREVRAAIEGYRSASARREFSAGESAYSRDTTSGYIETRRDNTPPPRIMTRDQYYRKTVEQTRTMLGRDKEEE